MLLPPTVMCIPSVVHYYTLPSLSNTITAKKSQEMNHSLFFPLLIQIVRNLYRDLSMLDASLHA